MKTEKKKKLKGMTLMEVIVAVAIMVLLSTMLVIGAVSAVSNMRIAQSVSKKNAVQAPYAATQVDGNMTSTMTIKLDGTKASLEVDSYEVRIEESAKDRVGNYRYFVPHK
ncbi:MAG: hypothetical protein E7505_00270 [Ruminococcus sp.]|nr:hypothetical protein [Ruminococcus sp.]